MYYYKLIMEEPQLSENESSEEEIEYIILSPNDSVAPVIGYEKDKDGNDDDVPF